MAVRGAIRAGVEREAAVSERIDLAREQAFRLGRLTLQPATREIVRDDCASEVVEPRVMQVLIALAQAGGTIVTRDGLTESCWEGRVVGEDAINRVISRLRRTAEGIGADSFRIETVTKIGYRLRTLDAAGEPIDAAPPPPPATAPKPQPASGAQSRVSRRTAIIAGAGAAIAAAAALLLAKRHPATETAAPPADVAALIDQAQLALRQDTREGQNQSIGLFRRVVELEPNYADGWGWLAIAYAGVSHFRASGESQLLRTRARGAAERAIALDPGNGYAQVALATSLPTTGGWLKIEQSERRALGQHPNNTELLLSLASTMGSVGREAEALALHERALRLAPPSPGLMFTHIQLLYANNRMEEADQLIDQATALYPTHFAVWFTRFYTLMYTGRANAAIAMANDRDNRPTNIPEEEIDDVGAVARAVESRDPAQADEVMQTQLTRAHFGAGYAENAIQFACALGRVDDAFTVANALYFDRGFPVPEIRFSNSQGTYSPRTDRLTGFLFVPVTAPMRADPRFAKLTGELGLERYWQESGAQPDYRRKSAAA